MFFRSSDQDSFLPSAIQRYHQLFVPSLQLIDGMLATLGTKHTTLTNQVFSLVVLFFANVQTALSRH
jgi:hypothetical protein